MLPGCLCPKSEIILGLTFEAELGIYYFEEVDSQHNCKGLFNKRSRLGVIEAFFIYLGFEIPGRKTKLFLLAV